MSKNIYRRTDDIDYYKSLSKIMILGLTGIATIGTSMLIFETTRSEASPLKAASSLIAKNILRLPALKPVTQNSKLNIQRLNSIRNISSSTPGLSTGSLLSSIQKLKITNNTTSTSHRSPLVLKTTTSPSSPSLKPKNSP